MSCTQGKLRVVGVPTEGLSRFFSYAKDMEFDKAIDVEESRLSSSTYVLTISSKSEIPTEEWRSDIVPFLSSYFGCLVDNERGVVQ